MEYLWGASLVSQMVRIWLQCRRPGLKPWVRKIPWRRGWLPIPAFLPGKSYGQKHLAGYRGHRATNTSTCTSSWEKGNHQRTEFTRGCNMLVSGLKSASRCILFFVHWWSPHPSPVFTLWVTLTRQGHLLGHRL